MSNLVQIIYISRSSAAPAKTGHAVDPVVARILAKSRANNRKNGLVGVLYFGDGCFFQCLEGEEAAVDTLYAKLEQDPRHRELKILSRTSIATPTFQDWSMKYVPVEQDIAAMLRRHGMSSFDPYRFTASMTDDLIALLHQSPDPDVDDVKPAATRAPAASTTGRGVAPRSRLPVVIAVAIVLAVIGAAVAALV